MKSSHQETRIKRSFSIFFIGISLFLLAISPINHQEIDYLAEYEPSQEQILRFGITLPYLTGNYVDLVNQINAKAVLDWRQDDNNEWAEHSIDYLHVIRVSDLAYANGALLDKISGWVTNNPGEVWIIGNEPDRDIQDGVTPEVYAQRYYEIAIRIRHFDPTAQIGFGSLVQPTPIRIRYLERALNYLTFLSCGNQQAALDLIDIWSIHAFILNEVGSWGASIPVGLKCPEECVDAILIEDYSDTYSIEIFTERILDFRIWMTSIGEREKPLWITEYGSLFPDWEIICPDPEYCIEPFNGWPEEKDTYGFMINTFDFLTSTSDSMTGFVADENRLVQRWFWYSLNDSRDNFGGTLFDPDNGFSQTVAGVGYETYTNQVLQNPDTGISPVIYRQDNFNYQPIFDELSQKYSYPYNVCLRSHIPLVFK